MESSVYNLSIFLSGFTRLQKQNINLPAGERLVPGVMRLDIGAVSEKIGASAQSAAVQTQRGERRRRHRLGVHPVTDPVYPATLIGAWRRTPEIRLWSV